MKRLTILGSLAMFVCAAVVQAQSSAALSVSAEVKHAYDSVKRNILASAEKVPDSDYIFKPAPAIRSFAEVFGHIASAQMHACAGVLGQQPPSSTVETNSKTNVVAALKESFDECDKAYDSLNDANTTSAVSSFRGQMTRLGALVGNLSHDNEQYGILTVYMRLKGIVPPSSERPMGGRSTRK
ncbi:MAG TPA: DinB family protein [Bryobacteraceae bacterium]|jgi:hypothetical protein|nr:DinB family protein [Bryobacteraceae bacterium]